ncbi:MAG: NupC/NupG family nucleoside CNT transporter [Candidatus Eremiobacteraeota bacterium]|nr:NupC/NupG family nucleoside CNT transporter [Candidatus Eremiobacteraeota bacterium]
MADSPLGQLVSLLGIVVTVGIAVLLSRDRRKIRWQIIASGLGLQFLFALIVLKTAPGQIFFSIINTFVVKLLDFTTKGSSFLFGGLVTDTKSFGFIFAFQVLPTIIFFSSFMNILYYLGIMQKIVQLVAKGIIKIMGTSGAETLCGSANIFVGQTEAPLFIRPYLESMTKSELLAVMTGGFATIAAGVMAAYVGMLNSMFPDAAGHLLAASVMSAPAALMMAKIIMPETEQPETMGTVKMDLPKNDANVIDAAANGASTGLQLALNVGGMLLAFIALIALLNYCLEWTGNLFGMLFHTTVTLNFETVFGTLFSPVAWVLGVPWKDCPVVGNLLAKVLVINEFVAYSDLSAILRDNVVNLSPRSVVIATYALCGFANFSSIAIQIGGIGVLAPSRRSDLARIGVFALIAGTLANYQTAAIAGLLVPTTTIIHPPKADTLNSLKDRGKVVRRGEFPTRDDAFRRFMGSTPVRERPCGES